MLLLREQHYIIPLLPGKVSRGKMRSEPPCYPSSREDWCRTARILSAHSGKCVRSCLSATRPTQKTERCSGSSAGEASISGVKLKQICRLLKINAHTNQLTGANTRRRLEPSKPQEKTPHGVLCVITAHTNQFLHERLLLTPCRSFFS